MKFNYKIIKLYIKKETWGLFILEDSQLLVMEETPVSNSWTYVVQKSPQRMLKLPTPCFIMRFRDI